jgi:putative DNA methylase
VNPASRQASRRRESADSLFAAGKNRAPDGAGSPEWPGASGLAEDVRYYGQWMRDEAFKRIGHLYPPIEITKEMVQERPDLKPYEGQKLTVIAWLWARTVKSPNPAFSHVEVPLASTFILSSKPGKEAYVQPVLLGPDSLGPRASGPHKGNSEVAVADLGPRASGPHPSNSEVAGGTPAVPGYRFTVKVGKPPAEAKTGTTAGKRNAFICLMSKVPISYDYIRQEGQAGRMGQKLMAIVAEGTRGRVYLSPTPEHEAIAASAKPVWRPDNKLPDNPRDFKTPNYGMTTFGDLFTPRQLVALTTFSDLVGEVREKIYQDALASLGPRASRPLQYVHSRGYLPHWEAGETPQFITFRTADSLPKSLLEQWQAELAHLPMDQQTLERRQRIEAALDQGRGACVLARAELATIVQEALQHFDGSRYRLHAWVIMPNHVHVLITPLAGHSLSDIVHSWKSFTAKRINKHLGTTGPFWQEEYFDRMIRDESHFAAVMDYIANNPVKAGLCAKPDDWTFSSAARGNHEREGEGERAGRPRSQDINDNDTPLDAGGTGARAYAEAVSVYLAAICNKGANYWSTLCAWASPTQKMISTFGRQALPMVWDFAEANPFSDSSGNLDGGIDQVCKNLCTLPLSTSGNVVQSDAQKQLMSHYKFISTDPPYYDNIGYARCFRTCSPRSPCPRPRNWSPHRIATAAERRPRSSSSTA